jgi:hypothetical protein
MEFKLNIHLKYYFYLILINRLRKKKTISRKKITFSYFTFYILAI